MKKALIAAAVVGAVFPHLLQAQQNRQNVIQIFMPKTVHVGDTAELRYIFQTEADLFADRSLQHVDLIADYPALETAAGDREQRCAIRTAIIDRIGTEYTLVLTLIPWKTGEIDFLPLDIAQWVRLSLQKKQSGAAYDIDFLPVQIYSLARELQATTLRPASPPLVIPGTTAILLALALVFLLLIAALIMLIVRVSAFSSFLHTTRAMRYMHRQARLALKKLRLLEKEYARAHFSLWELAANIQHILRFYLERRFEISFGSLATPALHAQCESLLGGDITETEQQAVDALTGLFMQTDYIRFAPARTDETERAAGTVEGAAGSESGASLLQTAASCIRLFDTERI